MSNELLDLAEQALKEGDKATANQYLDQYFNPPKDPAQEETTPQESTDVPQADPIDMQDLMGLANPYAWRMSPERITAEPTFQNALREIPEAIARGVGGSVNKTSEYVDYINEKYVGVPSLGGLQEINEDTSEELSAYISDKGTHLFSMFGTDSYYLGPQDWVALKEKNAKGILKADFGFPDNFDAEGEAVLETTAGNVVEPISRAIVGFVGVNKFLTPLKINKYVKVVAAGGIGEFFVFGGDEKNLANIAKDFGIENEYVDYLATNPENTETENRLRTALVAAKVGLAVDGLMLTFGLLRTLKNAKKAAREGDAEKAEELLNKAKEQSEELDATVVRDEPIIVDDAGKPVKIETETSVVEDYKKLEEPETVKPVEEAAPAQTDVLPPDLQNSKPRYNYGKTPIELTFENDIAKALYIVGSKNKSKKYQRFIDFLEQAGIKDIPREATKIREYIKAQAKAGNTKVTINSVELNAKAQPNKPKTQKEITEAEKQLQIETKDRRAELGSYRTNGVIDKVEPMEEILGRGKGFIEDLLRSSSRSGDDLSTFVKSLHERLRKSGELPSTQAGALSDYLQSLIKAQAAVLRSASYKANSPDAIAQAAEIRAAIQEVYAVSRGLRSDWGRTGLVLQEDEGFKMLDDLGFKDPEAVAKTIDEKALEHVVDPKVAKQTLKEDPQGFVKRTYNLAKAVANPKGISNKVAEYLQANLLFQWETIATNVLSTAYKRVLDEIANQGGAAVTGLRAMYPSNFPYAKTINGGRNFNDAQRHFLHASRTAFGTLKYSKIASKWGWETLMTGKNRIDPVFKVREEAEGALDSVAWGSGDVDLRELRKLSWDEVKNMSGQDILANVFGNTTRLSFRTLGGPDEFFKVNYIRSRLYADISGDEAFKKANADATPEQFDELVEGEVDRITEKLSLDAKSADMGMEETAQWGMREITYTDPLGSFGQSVQKLANDFPLFKVAFNTFYIRTPTNVLKGSVRRTPWLNKKLGSQYFKRMWEGGKKSQDKIIFEMAAMTLIYAKLAEMAYQKVVVPDGKGETIETYRFTSPYQMQEMSKNANYSTAGIQAHGEWVEDIDENGNSTWRVYNMMRADPWDTPLMMIAGFRDLSENGYDNDAVDLLGDFVSAIVLTASDKTTTRSFVDSITALSDPTNSMEKYFENLGRASALSMGKWFKNDEYQREVSGFWQSHMAQYPWYSEGLPPKFDALSRPIPSKNTGINTLGGMPYASSYTTVKTDDAAAMLFATMNSKISSLPTIRNTVIDLESDVFTLNGKTAHQRWNELVNTKRTKKGKRDEENGQPLEYYILQTIQQPKIKDELTNSLNFESGSITGSTELLVRTVINNFREAAFEDLLNEYESTGLKYVYKRVYNNAKANLKQTTSDLVIEPKDIPRLIEEYKSNN